MSTNSVSTCQTAMIAYLRVIWREWFFAYVAIRFTVKFLTVEIYGYISG